MADLLRVESFGGIDADADDLLDRCFQDHEAYDAVRGHERFLIIGRKGSGKTAIFKKIITTREPETFSFGHTFADYPWHHHDAQATLGVPEEDRYTHSWRYLILLTASKLILNQDQSQPWSNDVIDDIGKLENFVVDSYGSRDPDVTQFFAPEKKLRINPTLGIPGTRVEAGLQLERLPIAELPRIVQEVNRTVAESVMKSLNPTNHYYICFDQLDLGFEPSDPRYAQRLTGLILAARDLFQQARESGKFLTIGVFLRDDIYQLLRFEDKNKVSENYVARIEWDSPRTSWTLKQLMEERFSAVLGIPAEGAWEVVFDEEQEMRGRQRKYNHVLDRTFRRPRDIIKFCNEVLVVHKRRQEVGDEKFSNEDIIGARDTYSEYLLNELDDEIFKHVPEYENLMGLLRNIGSLQFGMEDVEAMVAQRPNLVPDGTSPAGALQNLFEFSVVGYLRSGGGGGGSGYVWRYLDPRARFDEAAPAFRVHAGLKEALGLLEGKPRRAGS